MSDIQVDATELIQKVKQLSEVFIVSFKPNNQTIPLSMLAVNLSMIFVYLQWAKKIKKLKTQEIIKYKKEWE